MPTAILGPILGAVTGIGGMISSNDQQKAAQKNNDNQNAAAVQRAQDAYSGAQQNLGSYIAANPAPFTGQQGTVARPPAYAPYQNQTGGAAVSSGQGALTPPQAQPAQAQGQQMNPQMLAMISQILSSRMGQGQQNNVAGQAAPNRVM